MITFPNLLRDGDFVFFTFLYQVCVMPKNVNLLPGYWLGGGGGVYLG